MVESGTHEGPRTGEFWGLRIDESAATYSPLSGEPLKSAQEVVAPRTRSLRRSFRYASLGSPWAPTPALDLNGPRPWWVERPFTAQCQIEIEGEVRA